MRFGTACSTPPIRGLATILCRRDAIWFIAAQQRLLPVLCVQTNRIVSFSRPAAPSSTGVNAYGGVTTATNDAAAHELAGQRDSARPGADIPMPIYRATVPIPYWTVLLPALPVWSCCRRT